MQELYSLISLVSLLLIAIAGGWIDIKNRIIPNYLVLIAFFLGVLSAAMSSGFAGLPSHLLHFVAALAIALLLFAFKFWGGGDGKLYAAVAVWFPLSEFLTLIFAISIVGLALTLAFLVRYRGKLFSKNATSIPYGVAIGFGAALAFSRDVLW